MPPLSRNTCQLPRLLLSVLVLILIFSGNLSQLNAATLTNQNANIPPQCYTKTQDQGRVYNPCYICHTRSQRPNLVNDHKLQLNFSLPEKSALKNPWSNLYSDRSRKIQQISDDEIRTYIQGDNYSAMRDELLLFAQLGTTPPEWDRNRNGSWDGYTPDCYYNFDSQGFDIAPDEKSTGWRAFAYYPFPGIFWPTNGSTDDILIRLDTAFQKNSSGIFDRNTYILNLAIVEAVVTQRSVPISPVDETLFGVDLNQDGTLGSVTEIVYGWDPGRGKNMSYVGLAATAQRNGKLHLAGGLFPEGTEFLHSVRYIGLDAEGNISLARRMKELRYMKKNTWLSYSTLEDLTLAEVKERNDFPDRATQAIGNSEQGLYNGKSWTLQGFIEDRNGTLRPQSFEETLYCIGCHGGIGITTDSVFGFSRKLGAGSFQNGWFHWSQKGIQDLPEPKIAIHNGGIFYEYSFYLMYSGSANGFRNNPETVARFYTSNHTLRKEMLNLLHDDISTLLSPSPERALALNRAYLSIVQDQSFILGREASLEPLSTIHQTAEQNQATGITKSTSIDTFRSAFTFPRQSATKLASKAVSKSLAGRGMIGPDGRAYGVDWQGLIHKSHYSTDSKRVHFTFPDRLTLPTRLIVPVSANPKCLTCHRRPISPEKQSSKGKTRLAGKLDKKGRKLPPVTILTKNQGQNQKPMWSPDGKNIAFVSDRSGLPQIWIMDANRNNQRQLSYGPASHNWPQWHPKGDRIVSWAQDGKKKIQMLSLLSVSGSKEQILLQTIEMLARPVFHPDGMLLAYAARKGGNWDIWLLEEESGKRTRLTHKTQMEIIPRWSPDGKILAYKVAPDQGDYSLTRQNFMSFENGYTKPSLHEWDGPESVQLSDWSPDAKSITYTAEFISHASGNDRVSYGAMVSSLRLHDAQASVSNSTLLSGGRTLADRGPVFSPDNRTIAFWAWNLDESASIWMYDTSSKSSGQLTSGGVDMYPQWSPDGSTLAFERIRNGHSEIATIAVP